MADIKTEIEHLRMISLLGKDDSLVCLKKNNIDFIVLPLSVSDSGFYNKSLGEISLKENGIYVSDRDDCYSFVDFQKNNQTKESFIFNFPTAHVVDVLLYNEI